MCSRYDLRWLLVSNSWTSANRNRNASILSSRIEPPAPASPALSKDVARAPAAALQRDRPKTASKRRIERRGHLVHDRPNLVRALFAERVPVRGHLDAHAVVRPMPVPPGSVGLEIPLRDEPVRGQTRVPPGARPEQVSLQGDRLRAEHAQVEVRVPGSQRIEVPAHAGDSLRAN